LRFEVHDRRLDGVLVGLLQRVEIAHRSSALDIARSADQTRLGEQAFGQRGLAGSTVTYQSCGADGIGRELRHAFLLRVPRASIEAGGPQAKVRRRASINPENARLR